MSRQSTPRRLTTFFRIALIGLLLASALVPLSARAQLQRSGIDEVVFNEGLAHLENQEFVDAEKSFRQLLEHDPNDAAAHYYLGLALLNQDRFGDAKVEFESASALDSSMTIAREGRDLAIAGSLPPVIVPFALTPNRRWDASFTLGYAYDSNVVQTAAGVVLPQGISRRGDSRLTLEPIARYRIINRDDLELGLQTDDYFAFQRELHDFDTVSLQIGPYLRKRINDWLTVGLSYDFTYIALEGDPFLRRNILTPEMTIYEAPWSASTLYGHLESREFDHAPTTQPSSPLNRSGIVSTIGLRQRFLISAEKQTNPLVLELRYEYTDQQTRGSDFSATFNTVGASLGQRWKQWGVEASLDAELEFANYANRNSLDAQFDRRRDRQLQLTAQITKELRRGVIIGTAYVYTDNQSSVRESNGDRPYQFARNEFIVFLTLQP